MKRLMILAIMAVISMVSVYAQNETSANPSSESLGSYLDTTTQYIDIEDKYAEFHPKAKIVNLKMEYIPLTGEVHLFYNCMHSSFDEGEAMNTAIAIYEDFAREHKYNRKRYIQKDKTKFYKDDRGIKMAQYVSYVMFSK